MFAKAVLDNGIRVVSQEMPDHRSASLGIWVENGSRHESSRENGISHFIEHLLFKGTERRSAAQIAEEMDAIGGHRPWAGDRRGCLSRQAVTGQTMRVSYWAGSAVLFGCPT